MNTIKRTAIAAALLALSGCATIENGADHVRDFAVKHPVVTAVGTAVVVGGVVYALDHHHHDRAASKPIPLCQQEAIPHACDPVSMGGP